MLTLNTFAVEIVMATANIDETLLIPIVSPPGFLKNKTSSSVLNHFNFVDIRLVAVWVPY